jgi:hypothetical protein
VARKEYRWIDWNIDHIGAHNISAPEAEQVVDRYPARKSGDDTFLARGKTAAGHSIQVAYLIDEDGVVFVIHARPLTENETRVIRRGRRR